MAKTRLHIVGKTEDGRDVLAGVFKLYDTIGLPLQNIFTHLEENNKVVAWIHFYEEALSAGWKKTTLEVRLYEAIVDVYGKSYCEVVKSKLEDYLSSKG